MSTLPTSKALKIICVIRSLFLMHAIMRSLSDCAYKILSYLLSSQHIHPMCPVCLHPSDAIKNVLETIIHQSYKSLLLLKIGGGH